MVRKRKKRRHTIYSAVIGLPDGSVLACGPEKKPSPKQIKEEGIVIDEDGIFREWCYEDCEWKSWNVEQRDKLVTTLAIRLNTRRAIRELVLPALEEMKSILVGMQERLERIESRN